MQNVLGYYIFDPSRGWLQDDEKTWKFDFWGACSFTAADLANEIAERESPGDNSFYVMGCLGSK